ncbi:DNA polymerase III subunit chi [Citreicella sp. C3M06]|uniref:DNA polymerase III subunit chi n=1 Tax=Roseobacteraceae TaxID=2854170 RepID=UPI001C09BFEB|nr:MULTISPECIES: DNA polymerase III subunit chi [Roseobacteraceae]MBU2963074.1 DNA polymerase III subunit chi [Citreicella sp. C3M06]MDO6586693.1 DNA polymerase III subunit chi [Salipiger sp. 1_MG-2023]
MGAAMFYHLTQRPLEATLPVLLERSLAAGWRVAVRGVDPGRIDWLDQKLWLGAEDGFLPHGVAGGPHDALQPVLLTVQSALPNDPACLMSVDGAEVSAEEVAAMERVCVLFDGFDERALDRARAQWRALKSAGCKAQYWSEESGRWEKKAET